MTVRVVDHLLSEETEPGLSQRHIALELGCEDDLAKVPCNHAGNYRDVHVYSRQNKR